MRYLTFLCMLGLLAADSFAQKGNKPIYLQHVADNSELPEIKNKFDRFKQQIMGHFGNARQVREKPEMGEKHQEFIIIPIFQDRPNEFWIYLEYFSPSMHDAPIDQRVEQYVRVNRDSIRMEVYYLKEPEKYINEWKKPNPFENLTKDDLTRDATCDLYILANEDEPHVYRTIAPDDINCSMRSSSGAAKYIVLWFKLTDRGYDMQFKFYDRNKKSVSDGNVVEFDRLDYNEKGYTNYAPGVKMEKKPSSGGTKP